MSPPHVDLFQNGGKHNIIDEKISKNDELEEIFCFKKAI